MMQDMDESFSYFFRDKGFGPAIHPRSVSPEVVERFKGRLPDQLLQYWEQFGWAGYAQGLFWLVDPDEYEPVLEAWIGDTSFMESDAYYVIARTAFGQLFLWGTKSGQSLKIDAPWGMIFPKDDSAEVAAGRSDQLVKSFIAFKKKSDLDFEDYLDKPMFERVLKRLGPLAADEMYGFEPALAIGGRAELKNVRRVRAVEHLVILAQLGERQVMQDIVQDAKRAGLL